MSQENVPRRSPVYDRQKKLGAVIGTDSGWEVPMYYASNEKRSEEYDLPNHVDQPSAIGVEHLSNRENVGIHEIAVLAPIEITGPSATEFIQRAFTNDMEFDVGRLRYTMMLNDDGENMGDLTLNRLDENRYLATTLAGDMVDEHTEWLQHIAPADVSVTNLDDGYGCIAVWGPNAGDVVQPLTDTDLSRDAFPFYTSQQIEIEGIPVLANRLSYVGEFGWELWTVPGYEAQLWDTLWQSGQDHDIVSVGLEVLLAMGVEKGYRLPGADMGPENTPFEAGLGFTVDMDTDFVGKETLERALEEGIDQEISCITMDDDDVLPEIGEAVLANGDMIGEVNRNAYGYFVQENILNAYLPNEYAEAGTNVEVEADGERYPATVREEPLFDPDDERLRG